MFPQGSLRQERWGLQALAECALGHDGQRVWRRFVRRAPGSPLTARVKAACGPAER